MPRRFHKNGTKRRSPAVTLRGILCFMGNRFFLWICSPHRSSCMLRNVDVLPCRARFVSARHHHAPGSSLWARFLNGLHVLNTLHGNNVLAHFSFCVHGFLVATSGDVAASGLLGLRFLLTTPPLFPPSPALVLNLTRVLFRTVERIALGVLSRGNSANTRQHETGGTSGMFGRIHRPGTLGV